MKTNPNNPIPRGYTSQLSFVSNVLLTRLIARCRLVVLRMVAQAITGWKISRVFCIRAKWIAACKRKNADGSPWNPKSKNIYLCGKHFITGKVYSTYLVVPLFSFLLLTVIAPFEVNAMKFVLCKFCHFSC